MASFPKEQVVKIRTELDSAIVVRPGDKLVIARADRLSQAQANLIKMAIGDRLPGVEIIVIDQCSGLAVYRDGDSAIKQGLQQIWNRIEESDEVISPAWLRRVIVESGAWDGVDD